MALNTALPKVSIVIPVYNGGDYLREAIDSALAQTYQNCEILVVNDGSTDGGHTEAVARSYGSKIRYFAKENGGTASALNLGIQNMEGEYFSWLSHDDLYAPEKVRLQVEALKNEPKNMICICYAEILMSNGRRWGVSRVSRKISGSLRAFLAMDKETGVYGCALLIPREAFVRCGLFEEARACTQDYDMWWRLAECYQVTVLKKPLVGYRCHGNQSSLLWRRRFFEENDIQRMHMILSLSMEELESYLGGDTKSLAHTYTNYARDGFPKASAAMILCGYRLLVSRGKAQKASALLARGILGCPDASAAILPTLERAQAVKKERPRLMVFLETWGNGSNEQSVVDWIIALSDAYEVAVAFLQRGENTLTLPEGVRELAIGESSLAVADRLLRLCMLLDIDLLANYANENAECLAVYPAFAGSGMLTVCVNHGSFLTPYLQREGACRSGRDDCLSRADALVWADEASMLLYNALTVGRKSVWMGEGRSKEAIAKWKGLLAGVLDGRAEEAISGLIAPASPERVLALKAAAFERLIASQRKAFQVPDAPTLALVKGEGPLLLRVKTSRLLQPLRETKYWLRKAQARRNPIWR